LEAAAGRGLVVLVVAGKGDAPSRGQGAEVGSRVAAEADPTTVARVAVVGTVEARPSG
jgi:hypothetical protein